MMIRKITPIHLKLTYPLHLRYPLSQVLFFDIETTGLSSRHSSVYLIGAVYHSGTTWEMIQWFAQKPAEEKLILGEFLNFAASYNYLIHFNGDTFDIPFLRHKSGMYRFAFIPDNLISIDLYRLARPYKKMLKLTKMNQTALEAFFGISRKDTYDGGQLIPFYYEYVKTASDLLSACLLLHNHDDLLGILQLLPILSYCDFMEGKFHISEVALMNPTNHQVSVCQATPLLSIRLILEVPLPLPLFWSLKNVSLSGQGLNFSIIVEGVYDTLKYFFTNYRDYYYLTLEDTAVHKSVASYVDKEHRVQAKASTCYCKKEGVFFPQKKIQFSPVFKREYSDNISYFEFSPNIIDKAEAVRQYVINQLHESF